MNIEIKDGEITKCEIDSEDLRNLDHTIALIIAPLLKSFREHSPAGLTEKEWNLTLDIMIHAFELIIQADGGYYNLNDWEQYRVNLGLDYFRGYFQALWW